MVAIERELKNKLEYAEAAVTELREDLLREGIPPGLVAFALFHRGVAMTAPMMDDEGCLMLCQTLETFIDDTQSVLKKFQS